MEKNYWLGRKRQSLAMARSATDASARLIHYDLAGRYSVRALSSATEMADLRASLPPPIFWTDVDSSQDEEKHA